MEQLGYYIKVQALNCYSDRQYKIKVLYGQQQRLSAYSEIKQKFKTNKTVSDLYKVN